MGTNRRQTLGFAVGAAFSLCRVTESLAEISRDDTPMLQDAIDRAVSGPSKRVMLEPRSYHLNGPLLIRGEHVVGLEVVGERMATILLQTVPDAPIFEFRANGLSHTNLFCGFTASWLVTTTAPWSKRAVFYMPSTGNTDIFNCSFERLTAYGCSWVFRSEGPSFWGNRVVDLEVGGGATGGAMYLVPDHQTGQPNNYFEKHYIDCRGMTGPIYQASALAAEMHAIEFNAADRGPTFIWDESGGQYNIGHFRAEVSRFERPTSLFHLPNGQLVADTIELATPDFEAPVWLISTNSNPVSHFEVGNLIVGNEIVPARGSMKLVKPIPGASAPDSRFHFGHVYPAKYRL